MNCIFISMTGYMYILLCSDNSYYAGSTKNLGFRLEQHQSGNGANYTKKRLPVELVYFEIFPRIGDAYRREKQVQGWSNKKKMLLIYGCLDELKEAAKCINSTSCENMKRDNPPR
ncbi:GIY-YIG nuclease superfamily protein [Sphingobacterium mizutaii]|uniref:GIY-YIG nuclease superfamily protein n=3 Tax=Sphingobacterium mizutaii TaxID=1010 RepID=A0AAJ5C094_9SPHI|nr:putative endonuclease [Sphingobacterium mizutaii]SNV50323.1 GIY-YIG nuclease superfamily protein [Sphingobacterium mizutaii]